MSETPAHNINSPHELREPRITLESDVVLAPETRRMFEEAIGAMRHHKTIYTDWGFGAVDPMGRNMIINLDGPPGTGKTSKKIWENFLARSPLLRISVSPRI